jgi:nicotinic acid mononucleotide adenylyltransferase
MKLHITHNAAAAAAFVAVATRIFVDLALDRLIVIPANVSPFKTEQPMIWERIELVKAAF